MTTPCECQEPGFCPRHRCEKTAHWHHLCRTRSDYFQLWEDARGPGQAPAAAILQHAPLRVRANPTVPRKMSVNGRHPEYPLKSAVVVISHNYGRFLAECLESVLAQTLPASEIMVIDDSSTDETPDIARQFADPSRCRHEAPAKGRSLASAKRQAEALEGRGIGYLRVTCRNVHQARRAGFEATTADVVCFLDADDLLPPDYLAEGLKAFSHPAIGVVYSDMELFGESVGRRNFSAEFDRAKLERDNFIHAGSLVRREALRLSRAFEQTIDPLLTQGDWFLWRQVLRDGWTAAKQSALYGYRQHGANWTGLMKQATREYFEYAGLAYETVTLFIPLSGRARLWPDLAAFLDRQTWPHGQTRLVLMDTSQNENFSATLRNWTASCDYPDVRHVRFAAARPGIADDDRHDLETREEVRIAVARIYNRLAREAATDYVWVVEDDVLPPDDACVRLLRGFDSDTVSVSGMYLSRFDGLPCAWDRNDNHFPSPGAGVQAISGTGFGCIVLRGGVLRNTVFQATGDYDYVFHQQRQTAGLKAKIDWRVVCQHRALDGQWNDHPRAPERAVNHHSIGVRTDQVT